MNTILPRYKSLPLSAQKELGDFTDFLYIKMRNKVPDTKVEKIIESKHITAIELLKMQKQERDAIIKIILSKYACICHQ